jgi:hypothetical protein
MKQLARTQNAAAHLIRWQAASLVWERRVAGGRLIECRPRALARRSGLIGGRARTE